MAAEIFISYDKDDRDRAEQLATVLESKGWSVWWDRHIPPGRTFDEVIEEALSHARCVIVLWSSHSAASRWVRAEASAAYDRGVLVPALIEEVSIPLEFRRLQAANLIAWNGQSDDPELAKLVERVGQLVTSISGRPAAPLRVLPHRAWLRRISTPLVATAAAAFVAGSVLTYLLVSGSNGSAATEASNSLPAQAETSPANSPGVAPPATPQTGPVTVPVKGRLNLLAQKNGGHLLLAPNESWNVAIDGIEDANHIDGAGREAIYGFKNDQPATFDTFGMLIGETHDWNVKEFELQVGNDRPDGPFESLGIFETRNIRQFPSAWQEFKFPRQRAKYLKVRIISTQTKFPYAHTREWQLLGSF